jgi:hypothetical protein
MMILFSSLTIPSFALTYTNTKYEVCVNFKVPEGWMQQDLKDDGDMIKARYLYSGDTGEIILFGFCELGSIGASEENNEIGNGTPNHSIYPRNYVAEIGGVDADAIESVNYHGIDYYKIGTIPTTQQANTGMITKLFCVINTMMYTFQYGSTKNDFSHFSDFEKILNHVVYSIPSDSNDLLIYQLKQKEEHKFPFLNLVTIIMFYSLPIFAYRYSISITKQIGHNKIKKGNQKGNGG